MAGIRGRWRSKAELEDEGPEEHMEFCWGQIKELGPPVFGHSGALQSSL